MPPEFSTKTIETLAKRVAYRCSNPDCGKLTTGPNSEPTKATSIGEAAHIYGALPGSARFNAAMVDLERATITNAIWLCRDCHGLIDRDAGRFPADLLLRWKEVQESAILKELGKSGELIRLEIADREADQWGNIPLFVKQLLRDKPDYWEYLATAELLDFFLAMPVQKARQLQKGLYTQPKKQIALSDIAGWVQLKIDEILEETECLKGLLNEIMIAWGEPGVAGNPAAIVEACRLYGQCAQRFVNVAEEAMFARMPEGFEGVGRHLAKGALYPTDRFPDLSAFVRSIVSQPDRGGVHQFSFVIELPDNWSEEFERLLERGTAAFKSASY